MIYIIRMTVLAHACFSTIAEVDKGELLQVWG